MIVKVLVVTLVTMITLFSINNCQKKETESSSTTPSEKVETSKSPVKEASKAKKSSKNNKFGKTLIKLPRSYKKGDVIEVKTVITHPQHTGIGKKAKPRHFINSINVYYGDANIASLDTHASISRDPYFSFKIKVTKSAPLKVIWKDNKGNIFEKSVDIKAGG
jgi:sulfur-oxidizing protein SoxZ